MVTPLPRRRPVKVDRETATLDLLTVTFPLETRTAEVRAALRDGPPA